MNECTHERMMQVSRNLGNGKMHPEPNRLKMFQKSFMSSQVCLEISSPSGLACCRSRSKRVLCYLFIFLNDHFVFIYLFNFGCIGSSLLRAGFLLLLWEGATLRCSARASHCGGFSCCGAWALGARVSVVVACGLSSCGLWALEHRLNTCGARA